METIENPAGLLFLLRCRVILCFVAFPAVSVVLHHEKLMLS